MNRDIDTLIRQDHINDLTYKAMINIALTDLANRLDLTLADMIRLARQKHKNDVLRN